MRCPVLSAGIVVLGGPFCYILQRHLARNPGMQCFPNPRPRIQALDWFRCARCKHARQGSEPPCGQAESRVDAAIDFSAAPYQVSDPTTNGMYPKPQVTKQSWRHWSHAQFEARIALLRRKLTPCVVLPAPSFGWSPGQHVVQRALGGLRPRECR